MANFNLPDDELNVNFMENDSNKDTSNLLDDQLNLSQEDLNYSSNFQGKQSVTQPTANFKINSAINASLTTSSFYQQQYQPQQPQINNSYYNYQSNYNQNQIRIEQTNFHSTGFQQQINYSNLMNMNSSGTNIALLNDDSKDSLFQHLLLD